jgi:hypothetical protein
MVIGWIEVLKKVYGETIYNEMAQSVLAKHHDLEVINVGIVKNIFIRKSYRLFGWEGKRFGSEF